MKFLSGSLFSQTIARQWLRAEVAVPEVADARQDVEALVDALNFRYRADTRFNFT